MNVIQLEIEDTLIQAVGTKSIQAFMERQLNVLKLQYLGKRFSEAIQESDIDHSKEVEEARQEAWQEYKSKYIMERL